MWEHLGNAASIIQIITAIPFVWGAYLFISMERRYKKRVEEVAKQETDKPAAMVISVSGTDITNQVSQFILNKFGEIKIYPLKKPAGITTENIPHILSEVLNLKKKMTADGVTEVHLFLMAPVAFGVAIGAILDNWVRVDVYHLNREKNNYEYWTYLHKGFIPGLEYSKVKEMVGE